MRKLLTILGVLLAAPLTAAEPALSVTVHDPARSFAQLRDGIYGRAVLDPALAPLRAQAQQRLAQPLAMFGRENLADLVGAFGQVRFDLWPAPVGEADDHVRIGAQVVAPELVDQLFGMLSQQLQPAELRDGTDATLAGGPLVVSKYADRLTVSVRGGAVDRTVDLSGASCVTVNWSAETLVESILARDPSAPEALLRQIIPQGSLDLSAIAEGFAVDLALASQPAWLAPLDSAVLERLPGDAMSVMATGVNAGPWWQQLGPELFTVIAAQQGIEAAQVQQQLDGLLAGLGVAGGIGELMNGLNGTMFTMLGGGGGLVPALTIGVPRSAALDQLVQTGVAMLGQAVPAEGKLLFLAFPSPNRDLAVIAPGVVLTRDATHWVISTDALMAEEWVAGATGGFMAAHGAALMAGRSDVRVLGWANTRSLLRSALPFLGLGTMEFARGRFSEALLHGGLTLVQHAGFDSVVGYPADGGFRVEGRGPLGGLGLITTPNLGSTAVLAGLMLPAINQARQSARRASRVSNMKQLLLACIVYQNDNNNQWPRSFDDMFTAMQGELPRSLLVDPAAPDAERPFVYVRPVPNAKSTQPVILSDPANDGGRCMVAYADGHIETHRGARAQQLWERAVELADDPTTAADGVDGQAWKAEADPGF